MDFYNIDFDNLVIFSKIMHLDTLYLHRVEILVVFIINNNFEEKKRTLFDLMYD